MPPKKWSIPCLKCGHGPIAHARAYGDWKAMCVGLLDGKVCTCDGYQPKLEED